MSSPLIIPLVLMWVAGYLVFRKIVSFEGSGTAAFDSKRLAEILRDAREAQSDMASMIGRLHEEREFTRRSLHDGTP